MAQSQISNRTIAKPAAAGHAKGMRAAALLGAIAWGVLAMATPALAGDIERARRIHDRLVGVPPTEDRLTEMIRLMNDESVEAAALYALEHPAFYMTTLKNFVTPWTNEEQTVFAPLNDYSALVIGMIRDDEPFNTVLSADLIYRGANGQVSNGYSHDNNLHYEQLEANRIDLSDRNAFVPQSQSSLQGSQLSPGDAAGVITTRAAGEAFFSAGTNRAMWRFTSMNYLCRDLEDMHDASRPADRIRQDVSRSPGGDSTIFLNSCIGCHSGMDPLAGAYAYFEWIEGDENDGTDNGRVVHTPGQVQEKHLINANVFPFGYVTVDNRWDNYWREGPNSVLGWPSDTPSGGYGPQSLGVEIGNSEAFAVCQVEKVFEQVCFRPDNSDPDRAAITTISNHFMNAGNYSMKTVFAQVAEYCTVGDQGL